MARSICTIEGCVQVVNGHGLCNKHYLRWKKYGTPEGGDRNHAPDEERFWRYVDKRGPEECWDWQARKQPNGYGRFQIGGKGGPHKLAHRLSFEYANGREPSPGKVVMHSCDRPCCVNPAHLSEGTYQENTDDMMRKGRNGFFVGIGEASTSARLTEENVRTIRSMPNETHASVARHYGVSKSTIRSLRKGITWKHIL